MAAPGTALPRPSLGNVPAPEITFRLLDGTQAAAHTEELQALHAEIYADPPYQEQDDAALFADRFRVQRRQPGFVLAEARHGGYLVGYAAGMPLRPSTSWWRDLTAPLIGIDEAAFKDWNAATERFNETYFRFMDYGIVGTKPTEPKPGEPKLGKA